MSIRFNEAKLLFYKEILFLLAGTAVIFDRYYCCRGTGAQVTMNYDPIIAS